MSTTQLQERTGTDSGIFGLKTKKNPARSKFDLSRKMFTTLDIGGIYPIDVIPTLPGDDFELSCRYQIDTFPLAVPPMTNYKVVTHWYYEPLMDLWKGAETYITKGRSGAIEMTKPSHSVKRRSSEAGFNVPSVSEDITLDSPMSLTSFLSGNIGHYSGTMPDSDSKSNFLPYCLNGARAVRSVHNVNSLVYLMYQKIYRDNYCPINLLQNNKVWFPDDISSDDWRIASDGSNLTEDGLFVPFGYEMPQNKRCDFVPSAVGRDADTVVNLNMLRYDTFDVDQFTSARPFLSRGEAPGMDDIDMSGLSVNLDWSKLDFPRSISMGLTTEPDNMPFVGLKAGNPNEIALNTYEGFSGDSQHPNYNYRFSSLYNAFKDIQPTLSGSIKASITANNLRNMIAYSVFQEINAQTNGNYNSTISAHFGITPRHAEFEPQYIGGTVDYIQFSQVLQTSASTSDSKLGSPAGVGNVQSNGYIGKFKSPDYGYIMGVMIIRPEVSYNQGVEYHDRVLDSDSEYWPDFAELGFQPITNKEIYFSDNPDVDNDLFGWQTRAHDLKTRINVNRGLMSLPSDVDSIASAYSQSREFKSLPKLSAQFVSMSPANVRRDFLAYPRQPAFKLQFASEVQAVRPIPYNSQPNTFGF